MVVTFGNSPPSRSTDCKSEPQPRPARQRDGSRARYARTEESSKSNVQIWSFHISFTAAVAPPLSRSLRQGWGI